MSPLPGRDGPVAHLAPDLRGDLRRGRSDQTRHLRLNRTTSWSLRTPLTFPGSARRAFCSCTRHRGGPARQTPLGRPALVSGPELFEDRLELGEISAE